MEIELNTPGSLDLDLGQLRVVYGVYSVNGKTGAVTLDADDVGALPSTVTVPTKTSQLTNDSGFLTEHQSLAAYSTTTQMNAAIESHHDNTKQDTISDLDTIRSGAALGTTSVQPSAITDMATKTWVGNQGYLTEHQSLSAYSTTEQMNTAINNHHDSTKQDTLTAGNNVQINNNVISATDTTYTAGTNITIDSNNVISATGGGDSQIYSTSISQSNFANALTAAQSGKIVKVVYAGNIYLSYSYYYSSFGTSVIYFYSSGPIDVIAQGNRDGVGVYGEWSEITGTLTIYEGCGKKQDRLTAGTNITIDSNNVISASGGSGTVTSITAGTGLTGGTITTSGTIAVDTSTISTVSYVNDEVDAVKDLIPEKTSDLTNDSGFITSSYHDSTKQDVLDSSGANANVIAPLYVDTGELRIDLGNGVYKTSDDVLEVKPGTGILVNASGVNVDTETIPTKTMVNAMFSLSGTTLTITTM